VKPYLDLTEAGKLRRLRALAASALAQYDLEDPALTYHIFATNLLYRVTTTSNERYPGLFSAFRRGYESCLAWPEDPIEPFQIGRLLWKINWVARNQSAWLAYSVKRHIPVFKHYQRTGKVILPPVA
jgi:hypothetical protein